MRYSLRFWPVPVAILLLSAACGSLPAQSQELWENLDALPSENVSAVVPGDGVVAALYGDDGMFLSYDGGDTWTKSPFPVRNVYMGSGGTVLLVGTDGTLYSSTDRARSFAAVDEIDLEWGNPIITGSDSAIYVIDYDPGSPSRVYRSADGGVTWTEVGTVPKGHRQFAVGPHGMLYCLMSFERRIYSYTNGFAEWGPVADAPDGVVKIDFGRDGLLYGWSQNEHFYRAEQGSLELKPYAESYTAFVPGRINVTHKGELIFVYAGDGPFHLIRLSSNGTTATDTPSPDMNGYFDVAMGRDDDDIWLSQVSDHSLSLRRVENGPMNGWDLVRLPGVAYVFSFDVSESSDLAVVTERGAYTSYDGGESFEKISGVDVGSSAQQTLLFVDTVLFGGSPTGVQESTDHGASWKTHKDAGSGSLFRADGGRLYAYWGFRTFESTDDGQTWMQAGIPSELTVVQIQSMCGYENILYASSGNGKLARSDDGGDSWEYLPKARTGQSCNSTVATRSGVFIGGYGNIDSAHSTKNIYSRYSYGEDSLFEQAIPCSLDPAMYCFATDKTGHPFLATACGLFRSDDDGLSWEQIADIPDGTLPTYMKIANTGTVYLGTTAGLYRAQSLLSTGRSAAETGDGGPGIGLSVRPNPVAEGSTVELLLERPASVRISLYDVTGRLMGTLANGDYPSGRHFIPLSIAGTLAPGHYFVRAESGGRSVERTIVLLSE